MDQHGAEGYEESTEESLTETEAFIRYVRGLGCARVEPVVTPRFIPTCTPALMAGLGQLARLYDCAVQSHISESLDEVRSTTDILGYTHSGHQS
eukprot:8547218-Pyramimonas_sp.AAC.1